MKRAGSAWLFLASSLAAISGEYFHAGNCLADKREKAFIRTEMKNRFKAAVWTCDTLIHVGGTYSEQDGKVTFSLDKPWDAKLVYKVIGKKLVPTNREKTFYGCGVREECSPEKDYYLRRD